MFERGTSKVHKECERLKMQIEAYENSKSWKATAPFRKIKAVWKNERYN